MAVIKAFKGMRFTDKAGNLEKLVCPPYDIINEEQRKAFLAENEYNIIRLELPREGEDQYAEAARVQEMWLNDGILATDDTDGIYIYEIEFENDGETKKINGIICRVRLEEFSKGIVLPHEETLTKAKEDRLNLMKATGANFSQIYSLYNDDNNSTTDTINSFMQNNAPEKEITDAEGLVHRLWIIRDQKIICDVCSQFAERKLYIADGHHRYETAINYRNHLRETAQATEGDSCDYIMMMLVDMNHEGLVVFPTHRIVRGLEDFDKKALFKKCADDFDIVAPVKEDEALRLLKDAYLSGKTAFAVCTKKCRSVEYTVMTYKGDCVPQDVLDGSTAVRGLDVSILHSMVLERALGIDKENMALQKNLTYTRDFLEAKSAVATGQANCAVIINPTRVSEIRDVAAAGEKMPQKSTYFYPKLITGMVMNRITNN